MIKLPRLLPVEPMLPWIKECCEKESAEIFAARCGISPKRVSDFTAGRIVRITFNTLDKMIAKEGSRSIIDFYPEYDNEEEFAKYENAFIKPTSARGCDVEGCAMPHHSKGKCGSHYRKHKKEIRDSKTAA